MKCWKDNNIASSIAFSILLFVLCIQNTSAVDDGNGTQTCDPGSYVDTEGACIQCAEGSYSSANNSESCHPCLAGTFASSTGAQTCQECEIGWFNNLASATSCSQCGDASSTVWSASTACTKVLTHSDVEASEGITITGVAITSISSAGDFNGDGIDDIVIGSRNVEVNSIMGAGQAFVIFGKSGGTNTNIDISELDGTNGFSMSSTTASGFVGTHVKGIGDVNGDGLADISITAPGVGTYGSVYIVYGVQVGGHSGYLNLGTLDGTNGFKILGNSMASGHESTTTRTTVSGAGDVDGDGMDDIIIGHPDVWDTESGLHGSGQAYVVYGVRTGGYRGLVQLGNMGRNIGFTIVHSSSAARLGWSVSTAGDVNGDGKHDIVIGAPDAADGAGEAIVLYGSTKQDTDEPMHIDAASLYSSREAGFVVTGSMQYVGFATVVSSAGDFNGDEVQDFAITQSQIQELNPESSQPLYGRVFIVFGVVGNREENVLITNIIDDVAAAVENEDVSTNTLSPAQGHAYGSIIELTVPNAGTGYKIASLGDFNGDGKSDLIIGDPHAILTPGVVSGAIYGIFGSAERLSRKTLAALDSLNGFAIKGSPSSATGVFVSSGDMNGDGRTDLIINPGKILMGWGFQHELRQPLPDPVTETPAPDGETPAPDGETPAPDGETPAPETNTTDTGGDVIVSDGSDDTSGSSNSGAGTGGETTGDNTNIDVTQNPSDVLDYVRSLATISGVADASIIESASQTIAASNSATISLTGVAATISTSSQSTYTIAEVKMTAGTAMYTSIPSSSTQLSNMLNIQWTSTSTKPSTLTVVMKAAQPSLYTPPTSARRLMQSQQIVLGHIYYFNTASSSWVMLGTSISEVGMTATIDPIIMDSTGFSYKFVMLGDSSGLLDALQPAVQAMATTWLIIAIVVPLSFLMCLGGCIYCFCCRPVKQIINNINTVPPERSQISELFSIAGAPKRKSFSTNSNAGYAPLSSVVTGR